MRGIFKGVYSKRREFASKASKFFLCILDLILEEIKAIVTELFPLKMYVFLLNTVPNRYFCYSSTSCAYSVFVCESPRDNTFNKTCVTSKDLDQPVPQPPIAGVLVYPYWRARRL